MVIVMKTPRIKMYSKYMLNAWRCTVSWLDLFMKGRKQLQTRIDFFLYCCFCMMVNKLGLWRRWLTMHAIRFDNMWLLFCWATHSSILRLSIKFGHCLELHVRWSEITVSMICSIEWIFSLEKSNLVFPDWGWVINYRWFNGNILMQYQYHSVHCLFPLRCDQHLENGAVCTALAAAFRMILRNHAQGRSSPSISWFSSIIRSVSESWTQFLWNIPKMFVRFVNICQIHQYCIPIECKLS